MVIKHICHSKNNFQNKPIQNGETHIREKRICTEMLTGIQGEKLKIKILSKFLSNIIIQEHKPPEANKKNYEYSLSHCKVP